MKYSELKIDKIEKLSGLEMKKTFIKIFNVLNTVDRPLFFTGLPGTGKTILAKALAKLYCKKNNCKAYYLQLSPDMTKTSVILGLRLENGNLVPIKGVVAEAMEHGDIVIVDEATHTTQQMLLMFNSILDRDSSTSIGDKIVYKDPKMRVIFCSNDSTCAGNIPLPQSFAQRALFFNFKYPNFEDEKTITKSMLKNDLNDYTMPESVISYIANIIRNSRSKYFPLSVRNITNALILLELETKEKLSDDVTEQRMEMVLGNKGEAKVKNIYKMIHDKSEDNIEVISSDDATNELLGYVVATGHENFIENILSACMYYADVDGFSDISKTKDKLKASIL